MTTASSRPTARLQSFAAWLADRAAERECDCPSAEARAYVDFVVPVALAGDDRATRLLPELIDHALRRGGLLP